MGRVARHRLKLSATYNGASLYLRTQADATLYDNETSSTGIMAGQQVGVKCKGWNAYAGLAYFHTEDYESRVYAYERSTLYTLSFPMLYCHGIRGYVVCRAYLSLLFIVISKL